MTGTKVKKKTRKEVKYVNPTKFPFDAGSSIKKYPDV
jgi:hypothetical protein